MLKFVARADIEIEAENIIQAYEILNVALRRAENSTIGNEKIIVKNYGVMPKEEVKK